MFLHTGLPACFWNMHVNQIRQEYQLLRSFGNSYLRYPPKYCLRNCKGILSNQINKQNEGNAVKLGRHRWGCNGCGCCGSFSLGQPGGVKSWPGAGSPGACGFRFWNCGAAEADAWTKILGRLFLKYWRKSSLEINVAFFLNGVSISLRSEISSMCFFLGDYIVGQCLTPCGHEDQWHGLRAQ